MSRQQVTTLDILNGTVANVDLGADVARANLLTNGGFEIWQRGTGPFSTNTWWADQWSIGWSATTPTFAITKETGTVDAGSQASAKVVVSVLPGMIYLRQMPKMSDGLQVRGRSVSVSIRLQASVAGAVQVRLTSDGTAPQDALSTPNTLTNTWQTHTATVLVPGNATYVVIDVNVLAVCTAYLDNAMLVQGSVPADYVPLHPADDLARCLRYYEQVGGTGLNDLIISAIATAASQSVYEAFPYRVIKAVHPTVTLGTWDGPGTASINTFSAYSVRIGCISAAAGAFFCTNGAAGSGIIVEANP